MKEVEGGQATYSLPGESQLSLQGESPLEESEDSVFAMLLSYGRIVWRHKFLVLFTLLLTVVLGYFWLERQTPLYRAAARIIIAYDPPKVLQVQDVVELGSSPGYRGQLTYNETQFGIIKSRMIAEIVLDREGLWDNEHLLGLDKREDLEPSDKLRIMGNMNQPAVLASRIQVKPDPNSMVVQLEFNDSQPDFAVRVINAVAKAYMDQNVRYKEEIMAAATQDLEKSLEAKRQEIQVAIDERSLFERQNELVSLDAGKDAIDTRMKTLEAQLTEVRSERLRLESRWSQIQRYQRGGDPFNIEDHEILNSSVVQLLKTRIVTAESELSILQSKYLEQHPELLSKQEELKRLRQVAKNEVKNLVMSVKEGLDQKRKIEEGLVKALEEVSQAQGRISLLAVQYERMKDKEEQLKGTEAFIAKRLGEMKESAKFDLNNVRILDEAILPKSPVSPRRNIVLGGSFMVGLLLSLLVALSVDYFDSSIKGWKDVEERLGQKVLGVVPIITVPRLSRRSLMSQREKDLYIYQNPKSNAAEANRTLRTNLLFMSSSHRLETLLITSASPSDGKSLMASHIASSMASGGKRILLVEADMRRPRLAKTFNLKRHLGLSSALVGKGPISDYVQHSEVENLDILVCGPIPPNPAELLYTPRMKALMEEMKGHYDTVIFDSPPVLPVADTLILSQSVDGVLLVARAGKTSRHALARAIRGLQNVHAPVLGTVINYQSNKIGGGYTYTYGYGYSSKSEPAEVSG